MAPVERNRRRPENSTSILEKGDPLQYVSAMDSSNWVYFDEALQ